MEVIDIRLPKQKSNVSIEPEECIMKETAIKERDITCSLNYEAEYNRLSEEYKKLKADRDYLAEELKVADREARWHHGFRAAVEIIFGKQNNRE